MSFLNINRPEILNDSSYPNYREKMIHSGGHEIVLSIYDAYPQDPYILFLPGTMTHPLFYDPFLSSLAASRFNVVGIHFLSHGKSPRDKKDFTFDDMIQNTRDAISYIYSKYNQKPIVLGTSQGGILSLAVAAQDTEIQAVFAHNAVLTDLKESISITRFPRWIYKFHKIYPILVNLLAHVSPAHQISVTTYLDPGPVFKDETIKHIFMKDPLGLTSYPISFLSSLINADLSGISNGNINCPVVLIAAKGDPLFTFDYTKKVYQLIKAPGKEILTFDLKNHLLFNECIDLILEPLVKKIREYTAQGVAANKNEVQT